MLVNRTLIVAGCLCAMLLGGCGHSSNGGGASVRALNLISGVTGVNVVVGGTSGTTILSGAGFEAIGSYVGVGSGNQQFLVTVAGGTGALVNVTNALGGGGNYTFVTYGQPGATAGVLLLDDFIAPPAGNFVLRVLTTSFSAGAIDVYLTAPGVDINTATPAITGATAGTPSTFVNTLAGAYEVRITRFGTKDIIYDATPAAFAQGTGQTIVAYSKGSGKLVNAAILISSSSGAIVNSTLAQFKVANGTSVASPLGVFVDGVPELVNIPFAGVSSYQPVAAGTRTVTVQASSTPGAVLLTTTPTFAPATDTSMALSGGAGAVAALTLTDSNPFVVPGRAQLRFVNVSPAFAAVDVYTNFAKLTTNLAANSASAYVLVDATVAGTPYQFDFSAAGTTTVVLSVPGQIIASGHVYTVYLIGSGPTLQGVLTQDN